MSAPARAPHARLREVATTAALLALACAGALGCATRPARAPGSVQRLLYVANKSRLTVYDIDDEHRRVKRIDIADAAQFKGIAASVPLHRIFLTSLQKDELIALDLDTDRVLWRKHYCAYADSPAITPDGATLYLPCRHAGEWWVIDTRNGATLATITTGRGAPYARDPIPDYGPHNTVSSADGTRVYLAAMTIPYVFVVDTATNQILSKVGPFSRGVRPFAVDDRYVYANVDGLLGFEVGEIATGKMLHRVEAQVPPERAAQVRDRKPHHHTPSHGIALRPGTRELWVSDDANGYLYVYDVSAMPPRFVAAVALFEDPAQQPKPGWITFSLDGRYAYTSCNVVVDAQRRAIAARIDTSERVIEVQWKDGRPIRAGSR